MDFDQPDNAQPETQGSGDDGTKPPRRTAVGAGGDDDWNDEVDDFDKEVEAKELIGWPLPELTFVKFLSNRSEAKENVYMERTLSSLNSEHTNLAFYYVGDKTKVNWFIGSSMPGGTTDDAHSDSHLKSVLQTAGDEIEIADDALSAETIKTMIKPVATHVGCITGVPATPGIGGEAEYYSRQIERLTVGLHGKEFGVLVLAIPVPPTMINKELSSVLDLIGRAQEIKDHQRKKRIESHLVMHENYRQQLELGSKIGMWLVGVYYFASDRSVFARLRSLLRAVYVDETDETSRPIPIRTHEIQGLCSHLEQLQLLRNKRDSFETLRGYQYLTPLNSRVLSAYIQVPTNLRGGKQCVS